MLVVLALIPTFFLLYLVYRMDRIEKEPLGMLAKVFFFGVLCTIPASITELLLESFLGALLPADSILYYLIDAFFIVALAEEFCKRSAMKLAVWKNRNFDYRFDAVVYAVAASMGFAALENVLYVVESGLSVGIMRALTAVPGHASFAVFMGIFLGEAKLCEQIGDERGRKRNMSRSLWIPILIHGIYDFCLFQGSPLMLLLWLSFIIGIDVSAVILLKKASGEDIPLFPWQRGPVQGPGQ